MNKYKVAESIVGKIIDDLKRRMETGGKYNVADEETHQELTDQWEDIVISELSQASDPVALSR